jgi:hypothetical protein
MVRLTRVVFDLFFVFASLVKHFIGHFIDRGIHRFCSTFRPSLKITTHQVKLGDKISFLDKQNKMNRRQMIHGL